MIGTLILVIVLIWLFAVFSGSLIKYTVAFITFMVGLPFIVGDFVVGIGERLGQKIRNKLKH